MTTETGKRPLVMRRASAGFAVSSCGRAEVLLRTITPRFIILQASGFYTHYPFIPDLSSLWRARGHCAVALPIDGPSTLILDVARRQLPEPIAGIIVFTEDVVNGLSG
jgi:hypothetical protein